MKESQSATTLNMNHQPPSVTYTKVTLPKETTTQVSNATARQNVKVIITSCQAGLVLPGILLKLVFLNLSVP